MNDYWNDPPEEPEPPVCGRCDDFMVEGEVNGKPAWVCANCGNEVDPVMIPDETEPVTDDGTYQGEPAPPAPEKCPHGNACGSCGACDHAADLAFDAAREDRCFGKR